MNSKVIYLAAVTLACIALSHGDEHAFSSAHISRHDGHHHPVEVHGHDHKEHDHHHVDYYTHPKYEFEYKVEDHHTGDIKSQHEHRDGHNSESGYSWHDPHGSVKVTKHVSHH
ncbi:adult-specific cuticular protein ACP-22-like [Battus philenor]|uniref:adult-specific cuticular protein ACP-22-like n=1 Tax=Battus philenor TaxID=42288 RepID=UPI0035CF70CC